MILRPNEAGFVKHWLISGCKEESYSTDYANPNQLEFEIKVREQIADDRLKEVPEIHYGEMGLEGCPWRYYPAFNNWFVDQYKFYLLLNRVEMYASTILCVPKARKLNVRLWTYAAAELWLNGEKQIAITKAVYKPMNYVDASLELQAGENEIFIRAQNLGVRDTRTIFGLQIRDSYADVEVKTHDFDKVAPIIAAENELLQVKVKDYNLFLPQAPSLPIQVNKEKFWVEGSTFAVSPEVTEIVLTATVNGVKLERKLENIGADKPRYGSAASLEEHKANYLKELYEIFDFNLQNLRYGLMMDKLRQGLPFDEEDFAITRRSLKEINSRVDCSDFDMIDLLRIMLMAKDRYPEDLQEEIKQVLLNYRYWMDEAGSDGMCFFSENHALCFHASQFMAGKLYPNDVFVRSGRTGAQQMEIGLSRCKEWLSSIEASGSEEFSAPGYTAVTLIALFTLVDFAEEETAQSARQECDRLFEKMAMHYFDGVQISPCGRIYGDVIKPYRQTILSVFNYFRNDVPLRVGTKFAPIYELSGYKIDPDLFNRAKKPLETVYEAGNAEVHICKTPHYMLTSVASERSDAFRGGWSGEAARKEDPYKTGKFTYSYVKGLNERFHGTTLFQPGQYGYQQHMWSAALSNNCLVFVNHPGCTHHTAAMRPGYWYGNGLFPALRQWGNTLLAIYNLEDKHPISFTHVYFPRHLFDEVLQKDNWLIGRLENGLVALWSSSELKPFDDYLTDCEYRAYDKQQGFVCVCSDLEKEGTLEQFAARCTAMPIAFDANALTLEDGTGHKIRYVAKEYNSQIV